jgi:zinc resistance-associated protein
LKLVPEEKMLKPVIAATAALAIAGSSIVYAQQRFGGPDNDGGPRFEHRHRLSAEDLAAFTDARIAALKAGLELTPDQAKNWPAFEQALRDLSQLRIQRIQARQAREDGTQQGQAPAGSPFDRLSHRADAMAKTSAVLKRVAETGTPLFQSLNDAQKHRFKMLARILRPHHHHHMMARGEGSGHGWHHGWRQGEGDGQNGGHGFWRHHRFGQDDQGPGGQMHRMMGGEDQGSEL